MPGRARRASIVVGWREWVSLPDLGVGMILGKVDSGAATCSLHATRVKRLRRGGQDLVRFIVPRSAGVKHPVVVETPLADERRVKSSNGLSEPRLVVRTRLRIGGRLLTVEINLTQRYSMRHPLLLGRNLLRRGFLVDCGKSFLLRSRP